MDSKTPSILVVDDNIDFLELVAAYLIKHGFEVESATDGKVGFQKYMEKRHQLSIVLLDIQMPLMNGYEVASCIRDDMRDQGRRIPIIAISGETNTQNNRDIDCFLKKPINFSELLTAINQFL